MVLVTSCSSASLEEKKLANKFIAEEVEKKIEGYPKKVRGLEGVEKLRFIYLNFRQPLFKLAYLYLKDEYLAEDAVSEVMLKLASKIDDIRLEHPRELASYLRLITKSTAIDLLRYRSKECSVEEIEGGSTKDVHQIFDRAEFILSTLPKKDAEILRLVCIEDRILEEAAQILDIKLEATKKRYQRAKRKLLRLYREIENEENSF